MSPTLEWELTSERRVLAAALGLFVAIAALFGVDLALDARHGTTAPHLIVELALAAGGLVGAFVIGHHLRRVHRRARASQREVSILSRRLEASEAEASRFREESREVLLGLSAAIDRQLERWGLTPAEKEVALLLLKGLSHKEIAAVRGSTEATARQQSRAVYRKAGLSGRNELAAFFLEDLLLPARDPSSSAVAEGRSSAGSSSRRHPG